MFGNRTQDTDKVIHKTDYHMITDCGKRIQGNWHIGPRLYSEKTKDKLCPKCFPDKDNQ